MNSGVGSWELVELGDGSRYRAVWVVGLKGGLAVVMCSWNGEGG